ncbi:hypothetical protein Gpo141_00001100 [Globisporangium polare]
MLDASESPAASPSPSPMASDHQFAIWRNRVHRELEKCSQNDAALPPGVTLKSVHVDEARGTCVSEFHCFVPFQDGSDALALIPLTALRVSMPYEPAKKARGDAQFPYLVPEVTVQHGSVYLPSEMVRKRHVVDSYVDDVESSREYLLVLPMLENWSPSNTLVMILHEFVAMVQKYDPPVVSKAAKDAHGNADNGKTAKRMRMRKRDIVGPLYMCQEVDTFSSTLVATPMLLQSGSIVLLVPLGGTAGADDPSYVYVSSLIPLKEIVRITPQRGKSVTLFFRDRKLSCRTFLTKDTDAISAAIRQMIAATGGVKRGRDDDSNPLTQLLSYLSPEHSEKAKEMSSKFMGKLSKVANSMSRFLRGDDEEEDAKQRDHEMFTSALNETNGLKEAFYRTPSKDRMTEITRRYQSITEEFALRKNAEGYVERSIEELQHFIEHPASKRILSEASACEQFNRGIRVGPA